jgi:hypothetical protein
MADDTQLVEVDALVAALGEWLDDPSLSDDWRSLITFAGGSMAEFHMSQCDGTVAGWDPIELHEFLVGHIPRKLDLAEDEIDRFPLAVAEVLRFLRETGRLDHDTACDLALRAIAATDEFVAAAADPGNFGPAKALFAAMAADGVDVQDQDAVNTWIEAYNGLSIEERKRRVPMSLPSADVVGPPAGPVGGKGRPRPAKARKAQRQARRRNRGR